MSLSNLSELKLLGIEINPDVCKLVETYAGNLSEKLKTFHLTFEGDNTQDPVENERFAKALGSFHKIETMRITISLDTKVGDLFHQMVKLDKEFHPFETVNSLEVFVEPGLEGEKDLAEFIGSFRNLQKLMSQPSAVFNPFAAVKKNI